MDSGCSFHMSPNLGWFDSIVETSGSVILGNDQVCYIKGIGSVRLKVENGSMVTLSGVRYIPDVKRNLISLGSLEQKGCSFASVDGVIEVCRAGQVLMRAVRKGSLYYMNATVQRSKPGELHVVGVSSLDLWHSRLGHPADGIVKELVKNSVISVVDDRSQTPCEECVLGKSKKLPFPRAATAVKLLNKCPSSSLDGDTLDHKWYGDHGDYSRLRVFECKAFAHLKQGKLDARALRCVLLGYQDGVKEYRLWCIEPGKAKVVISRDVVFTESEMPFKKQSDEAESSESTRRSTSDFEEEGNVPEKEDVIDTGSEVAGDNLGETEALTDDLRGYQLARDRVRRQNVKPTARYSDAEMFYFALCVAEEVEFSEPSSYTEAMQCEERDKWLLAMIEEIDSLLKNKTWILVYKVDLGCAKRIRGMNIIRNRAMKELWLNQTDYISRLLKRFRMQECKPTSTPLAQHFKLMVEQKPKGEAERQEMRLIPYANIIGSIMYGIIGTRPDIAQAVSVTSHFMADHGSEHWPALKWVVRYLKGAGEYGILYKRDGGYEGDDVRESFWLKGIASDFSVVQMVVEIGCDNNTAICLARHQVYYDRSQHIDAG